MDEIQKLNSILFVINKLLEKQYVTFNTVSDKLNLGAWQFVYNWFSENDKYNGLLFVVVGSNQLTKCNDSALNSLKESIKAQIHKLCQEEEERELDHKIKEDTLKNNRITRLISWISLVISLIALIVSFFKE